MVAGDLVRLTLAYRAPFAWEVLVGLLARKPRCRAWRWWTVGAGLGSRCGWKEGPASCSSSAPEADPRDHLQIDVSPSLLPALMPLLARLRHLLDLDAEPTVVDAQLERGGLGTLAPGGPGFAFPALSTASRPHAARSSAAARGGR